MVFVIIQQYLRRIGLDTEDIANPWQIVKRILIFASFAFNVIPEVLSLFQLFFIDV